MDIRNHKELAKIKFSLSDTEAALKNLDARGFIPILILKSGYHCRLQNGCLVIDEIPEHVIE